MGKDSGWDPHCKDGAGKMQISWSIVFSVQERRTAGTRRTWQELGCSNQDEHSSRKCQFYLLACCNPVLVEAEVGT